MAKKYRDAVSEMRKLLGPEKDHKFKQCTMEQCRDYLQYKKRDKDPRMPKTAADRRVLCATLIGRASPVPSVDEMEALPVDEMEALPVAEMEVQMVQDFEDPGPSFEAHEPSLTATAI